jgi:hypothetical protein
MSDIQNPGTTQEQNNRKIGIVQILFFGVVGTTVFVMAAAAVIFLHF